MEPLYELAADFAWRIDAGLMRADDIPPGWEDRIAAYKLGFTEGQTDRLQQQREELEAQRGGGGSVIPAGPRVRAGTPDEIAENRRLMREKLEKAEKIKAEKQAASEGKKGAT